MSGSEELRLNDSLYFDERKVPSMKNMTAKELDDYSFLPLQCAFDYLKYNRINKLTVALIENVNSFCLRTSLTQVMNQFNVGIGKIEDHNNLIRVQDNLKAFIDFFHNPQLGKPIIQKLIEQRKVFDWAQITLRLVDPEYNFADSGLMEDLLNLSNQIKSENELSR